MFRAHELPARLDPAVYSLPVIVETEDGVRTRPAYSAVVAGYGGKAEAGTVILVGDDLVVVAELHPYAWVRLVETEYSPLYRGETIADEPNYVYDGARGDWYDASMPSIVVSDIPADWPVQPDANGDTTCGYCGLTWNDAVSTSMTPVPAGRCPFEEFHRY